MRVRTRRSPPNFRAQGCVPCSRPLLTLQHNPQDVGTSTIDKILLEARIIVPRVGKILTTITKAERQTKEIFNRVIGTSIVVGHRAQPVVDVTRHKIQRVDRPRPRANMSLLICRQIIKPSIQEPTIRSSGCLNTRALVANKCTGQDIAHSI